MKGDGNRGQSTTPDNPGDSIIMRWIAEHLNYPHDDHCLIWPFGRVRGYGSFGRNGKSIKAHRYICELKNGPPPTPEYHAAHSCNRGHHGCANPHHLIWKTRSENLLDSSAVLRRFKLNRTKAEEIRSLKGIEQQHITAQRFGVRECTVKDIQSGRTWK
jgi:hypothetical protein